MARTRDRERFDEVVDLDDAALLSHAVAGDGPSVDELYRRHADAALRVAYAVIGNRDDAADAVSDAFLKVLRVVQEGRFPAGVGFRPYLLVATRNAALDIGRSRTKQRKTAERDLNQGQSSTAAPASADFVLEGVDAALVASAFAKLPERWRTVLWLTEVEGVPAREAAPILGLSANGVAQLAVRARDGLRNAYLQVHLQGEVAEACRPVVNQLGAYVGGALSARDIAKVDQHLAACEACRARKDELDDLRSTLRRIAVPLPVGLAGALAAKWKLATGTASATKSTAGQMAWNSVDTLRRPLMASAGILAAVGIIGVGVYDAGPETPEPNISNRPRQTVSAPQAVVGGFDLGLTPATAPPADDPLLLASPRLSVPPGAALATSPPPAGGGSTSGSGGSSPPPPATNPPKAPVPLAQVDAAVPAAATQVSVGLGAGACTSVELTVLAVGDCPAPAGSGPLNVGLRSSLLGG